MLPFVADHKAHMNRLENGGEFFASGPFIQEGVVGGDGLTILQTNAIEDARTLIQAEPLIQRGLREFDLRPRKLREGRLTITLNDSTSGFRLDSANHATPDGGSGSR